VVPFARILRLASIVICLIVAASFALFAINKTSGAAAHQEALVNEEGAPATGSGPAAPHGTANAGGSSGATSAASAKKSSLRSDIDDAANTLTSPFAGIVSDTSSQWTIRTVKLLLTLAIYGFGLGFLARVLRVGA
jgi:hypothetical protein